MNGQSVANIHSFVAGEQSRQYGYLFHPISAVNRDQRQTEALHHLEQQRQLGINPAQRPFEEEHATHPAHSEQGSRFTPGHLASFLKNALPRLGAIE